MKSCDECTDKTRQYRKPKKDHITAYKKFYFKETNKYDHTNHYDVFVYEFDREKIVMPSMWYSSMQIKTCSTSEDEQV